jgi:hypothetical protein
MLMWAIRESLSTKCVPILHKFLLAPLLKKKKKTFLLAK